MLQFNISFYLGTIKKNLLYPLLLEFNLILEREEIRTEFGSKNPESTSFWEYQSFEEYMGK